MMQIVIDIPKEYYERVTSDIDNVSHSMIVFDLLHSIANGTVLEPHGRCVDVDAIVKKYGDTVAFLNGRVGDEYIHAPTILEAWRNEE